MSVILCPLQLFLLCCHMFALWPFGVFAFKGDDAQKEPSEQVKVSLCFQYHVEWKVEAPQCLKSHATWTLEDPQYYNTAYTAQNGRLKFTLLHTSCKMEGWSSNMLQISCPKCCKYHAPRKVLYLQHVASAVQNESFYLDNEVELPRCWTYCKCHAHWKVLVPKCCKRNMQNERLLLQNAANAMQHDKL